MLGGSKNLVSSDGAIMEGPQKTNKRRRRRANTHRKTKSPLPQEVMEPKVELEMPVPNSISEEKEEAWIKSLWDEIQEANTNREGKGKAPLAEIDLQKEQMNLDIAFRYQAVGPTSSQSSKSSIFKKLPSFVGDYKIRDDIRKVPT